MTPAGLMHEAVKQARLSARKHATEARALFQCRQAAFARATR